MHARIFVSIVLTSLLIACSDDEPIKMTPAQAAASTPPAGSQSPAPVMPAGHPAVAGKTLVFQAPDGWVSETPASPMRKAQYKLPKQSGDPEDAQVIVSFFGAEAGSVDANVERWAGMFEQPGGGKSIDAGKRSTRTVNGMSIFEFDLSGTLSSVMSGGSTQPVHKENWREINAVVKSDHGSYYIKLNGPAGTVAHWEPSYQKFVDSAKSSGG